MAQFDILSIQFSGAGEPQQLMLTIDNPLGLNLAFDPQHNVPSDVQQVPPGGEPSQDLWVYSENYHLTVSMSADGGDNPLVVTNTGYFDGTADQKYLDIVIAEVEDEVVFGKEVRRRTMIVNK